MWSSIPSHTYCPSHAHVRTKVFVITIFVLLKVSGGSGPLCVGIQVSYLPPHSCFHLEGETPTRLPVESHPPAKEIASPPLNTATPPEHPVTPDQTKSQSKWVIRNWIVYQLYISVRTWHYTHNRWAQPSIIQTTIHSLDNQWYNCIVDIKNHWYDILMFHFHLMTKHFRETGCIKHNYTVCL